MNVIEYYRHELATLGYQADPQQIAAIERLQRCYEEWIDYKQRRRFVLNRWLNLTKPPQGVYLWGGVGRGKSFLMDCFYSVVPIKRKTRIHFHEFMRDVHRQLELLKGKANPLDEVAKRIAQHAQLICFDEFHVSDIADAMILYRLLVCLFERGVQFITTSNYQPDQLYPDGLHRDRFLPAIALIKSQLIIQNVDAGTDYRQLTLAEAQAYWMPLGAKADKALRDLYSKLTFSADESSALFIEQREIHALRRANGIVWFDFATLCGGPRSQNDYLELASRFSVFILSQVPKMSVAMSAEARRFTWLIDVLYDHRIKLFMSAEVEAEELYTEGPLANEFARTVSRMTEMQSSAYLQSKKRTAFQ